MCHGRDRVYKFNVMKQTQIVTLPLICSHFEQMKNQRRASTAKSAAHQEM
jgi:hypothetical protein